MFKKKSNLPPRPQYPTTDQIIVDLSLASNDDPLFATSKMILQKKSKGDGNEEYDGIYQKIKKLFQMHEELKGNMENLAVLKQSLAEKENDIIKLSNELKSQALKALV